MIRTLAFLLFLVPSVLLFSQAANSANDEQAAALLQKVSAKYSGYKNVAADFKLLIQRPKLKPEESDKKYTDTLTGKILLQQAKFSVSIKDQQIICDGKNIWTYNPGDKEVQVNYFEETDDIFSPAKIFSMYKEGYMYQIKEKKTVGGKNLTVIEMAPNKKLSYFKIDVSIDEATLQIVESKIYEKSGVRYVYKITKQTPNTTTTADSFTFDAKKFPGVKVVDLR
ncbi:MAG: outer membrane lipoprotein carrier protein LolA [Chitinophagales bacterium]|nr:outer membrane lipoprotein carrier protein LolA [Chitinophagales bacterium]